MRQFRRGLSLAQAPLTNATLEIVQALPEHPKEGRIVIDKTGGANDGQVVMYNGAAWVPLVGNKVWHEGNDGSGSGLDADTLDGYHLGGTSPFGSTQPYIPLVKTDGVMEVGRYLDFHAISDDDQDHTARLSVNSSTPGELYIQSNKIWHTGNFNPANYLPLTGGTLTGGFKAPSIEATEAPSSFGTQRLARAAQMIGSTNLDFILFQPWLGVIGFFWNAPSAPCAYGFVELKLYYSGANFAPAGNGPTEVYIQEVTSWDGLKKWRRSIRTDSVDSYWDPWYEVGAPQIGTWTPVIKSSGGVTMALTTATGRYAKNGKVVECWFFVESESTLSDPYFNYIPTLPFTPAEALPLAGEASSPQGDNGVSSMHRIYVQPSAGLQCIMYAAQYGGVTTSFTSQISGHFSYLTNA